MGFATQADQTGQTRPPEPLTPAEVHALIDAASRYSSSGIRLRALVAVMYGGGLRISEALALSPRDVDTRKGSIRVRKGKGGKTRTVGVDPRSCELLEAWQARRTALGLTARHPLFATYTKEQFGRPLSPIYVRRRLAALGVKADVAKPVRPHGLRHSLAHDLADRRVPMHVVQAQLGHASLAVTDRYVRSLNPTAVIDAMRERDW
jgi:integrase